MQTKPTSLLVINFITGMSDGMLLPLLCCIAGIFFPQNTPATVVIIGITCSITGGFIYAYARYKGEKNEIEHNHPSLSFSEKEKEKALMQKIGIDAHLAAQMQNDIESEQTLWLSEMEQYKMGWHQQDENRAKKAGLQTGMGFFSGGLLISILFFLSPDSNPELAILTFCITTLLFTFGWLKGLLLGSKKYQRGFYHVAKGALIYIAALVLHQIFS